MSCDVAQQVMQAGPVPALGHELASSTTSCAARSSHNVWLRCEGHTHASSTESALPSAGSGYCSSRVSTISSEDASHLSDFKSLSTGTEPFSLTLKILHDSGLSSLDVLTSWGRDLNWLRPHVSHGGGRQAKMLRAPVRFVLQVDVVPYVGHMLLFQCQQRPMAERACNEPEMCPWAHISRAAQPSVHKSRAQN